MHVRSWKHRIVALLAFTGLQAFAFAQKREEPRDPFYAKYPVKVLFRGKSALPNLSSPESRAYRTRLRYAAKKRPNFADHFEVASWGCGSACLEFAIIDARNGKVTFFPFTVSQSREKGDQLNFRRDSRALHVIGELNEKNNSADRWYLWTGNRFKLLNQKPAELLDNNDSTP